MIPSLSAIKTNAGSELAFIFFIVIPRYCLTALNDNPIFSAVSWLFRPDTTKYKISFSLSLSSRYRFCRLLIWTSFEILKSPFSIARSITEISSSLLNGLHRKSTASFFIALTASGISHRPLKNTTGISSPWTGVFPEALARTCQACRHRAEGSKVYIDPWTPGTFRQIRRILRQSRWLIEVWSECFYSRHHHQQRKQ